MYFKVAPGPLALLGAKLWLLVLDAPGDFALFHPRAGKVTHGRGDLEHARIALFVPEEL